MMPKGTIVHELSIADSIVKTVLHEMDKGGFPRVLSVTVRIGALTDIVPDSLEFGFDAIKRDTALHDTKLIMEQVPIKAICSGCQHEFEVEEFAFRCPACESHDVHMTRGNELDIACIEVDEPLDSSTGSS